MKDDSNAPAEEIIPVQLPGKFTTAVIVAFIGFLGVFVTAYYNNRPNDQDRFYGWEGDAIRADIATINRKIATLSGIVGEQEEEADTLAFEIAAMRRDDLECEKRQNLLRTEMRDMHREAGNLHTKVVEFQAQQHQQNKYLEKMVDDCNKDHNRGK